MIGYNSLIIDRFIVTKIRNRRAKSFEENSFLNLTNDVIFFFAFHRYRWCICGFGIVFIKINTQENRNFKMSYNLY